MLISPSKKLTISLQALCCLAFISTATPSIAQSCIAKSGDKITPVIELYTSEGCSSCPPADKWLSTFKDAAPSSQANPATPVVQAFHVNYWDYIGWTDRFATPAHTTRQRQVSAWQNSRSIYTPQVVRNGRDLSNWSRASAAQSGSELAPVSISLKQERSDIFSAEITPQATAGVTWSAPWAAYWTVTEHGHSSKVLRGENSGEQLKHDFVVRQYQPAGERQGAAKLALQTIARDAAHPRQINLVIFNPQTGKPLQAVSLSCG